MLDSSSIRMLATSLAVILFYGYVYSTLLKRLGPVIQPVLARMDMGTRHSVREVTAISKLAAAGCAQMLFAIALMVALGIRPTDVLGSDFSPVLILLGAILGIGELALTSMLCSFVVQAVLLVSGKPEEEAAWLTQGRGGWMALFLATASAAPMWFATASIGLYVAVEELVFRGVLIEVLRDAGAGWAIGIALLLFVAAQAFSMPSLKGAMYPMAGAFVIGIVHGLLYWHVPTIIPLVVGHLAYFAGALGLSNRQAPLRNRQMARQPFEPR